MSYTTIVEDGGYETMVKTITVPVTSTVYATAPVTRILNAVVVRLKTLVYRYSTIYGKPQTKYVTKYTTVFTTKPISMVNSYVATRVLGGGGAKPPRQGPNPYYSQPAIAPGHGYGKKRRNVLAR